MLTYQLNVSAVLVVSMLTHIHPRPKRKTSSTKCPFQASNLLRAIPVSIALPANLKMEQARQGLIRTLTLSPSDLMFFRMMLLQEVMLRFVDHAAAPHKMCFCAAHLAVNGTYVPS